MMRNRDAELADFMARVQVQPNGCWLWNGVADSYGQFRGEAAHRASWRLHQGPIPEGLDILHGCDLLGVVTEPARGCVNPAHLRPGTPRENAEDARRSRHNAAHEAERRSIELACEEGRAWLETVCPDAHALRPMVLQLPNWAHVLLQNAADRWEQTAVEFLSDLAEEHALQRGLNKLSQGLVDDGPSAAVVYVIANRRLPPDLHKRKVC